MAFTSRIIEKYIILKFVDFPRNLMYNTGNTINKFGLWIY